MNALIAFFKSILEVSLFASAMIIVVLLIKAIVKDRINIKVISILWLLVILRLCLPGMLESPVHVDGLFPALTEAQEVTEQPALQSEDTRFYQKNTAVNPLADNKAVTPGEAVNQNQTATAGQRTVTIYEQALGFLKSLDLWLVAAIVWLIGGAIVLASVLKESLSFGLRIRKSSRPLHDKGILDIVAAHRAANRLRRTIRVSVCSSIQMPLAFGVFHPHILLPAHMTEKLSEEHIDAILLHEVCHIKRNDILKSYACVLAKALHWFNPLVWVSMKKVKADMEFACDQRVLRFFKTGQEIKYCESLLIATRFMKQMKIPQFATTLCESRSNLKVRIVKMIKPQKKSRPAVAISLALALIMFVAGFTTACQPTPEEPIVVGKEQEVMLSAAAQTPSAFDTVAEQVDSPASYTSEVSAADGKLTVSAGAAAVVLSDTNTMSILRVTAADFMQKQVDGLISALFEGRTLYEVEYGPETKDELSEQIVRWEQLKKTEEYSSEGDQAQVEEHIAMLKGKYEKAPETSEDIIIESDGQLKQTELTDYETEAHIAYYMGLNATTNPDDYTKAARIWVQNNNDLTEPIIDVRTDEDGNVTGMSGRFVRRMAMLKYENRSDASNSNFAQHTPISVDENTVIDDPEVLAKLATTPAQAKAQVEDMLARAGIDNMTVVAMYLTDDENLGNYDGLVSPAEHYAYKLILCRIVDGVPVAYIRGSSGGAGAMENAIDEAIKNGDKNAGEQAYSNMAEWAYETIDVMVNDTGIISLDWYSPLELGDIVVANATLLPFADISDKFEKQMKIKWETRANGEGLEFISFTVDHVSLEYQRIAEQDALDSGLLVPVWNFYGTCTAPTSDGGDVGRSFIGGDDYYSNPLMTMNAIDGSIIDIGQGY